MQPKAQRIFVPGGVNLNRDARMIRRDQLALSKNAWPVIPGILGKRNGVQGVGRAIRVPSPTSLTNRYFPMSWALMPPINGYKYATHFHKDVYGGAGPSNFLVASSLDNETEVFPQGKVQTLNSWNTEYEPTRFVTYRNWLFAIVPGVEGFYVFAPQIVGAGVSQNYVWTKASFLFPPDTVNVQNSQLVPATRVRVQAAHGLGQLRPGHGQLAHHGGQLNHHHVDSADHVPSRRNRWHRCSVVQRPPCRSGQHRRRRLGGNARGDARLYG